MDKERFSLLLLDPGEIFFEDFSVMMVYEDVSDCNFESLKQMGRLKMCSKSIVFDPKDIANPLLKIPLKECTAINEWHENRLSRFLPLENGISVDTIQHVQMLEGNVMAPYKFVNKPTAFVFFLNYVKVRDCLPHLCQLHRASSLPVAEQNGMIAAIVFSRQSRVSFDQLWLEDLYEQIVLEVQGGRITPLVSNPGRILLTSACLYFQPFNNVEQYPVLKIQLQDMRRVVRRRFLLRQVGLEIYCAGHSKVEHLFLCLSNPTERDQLYEKLLEQPATNLEETNQEVMTLQWQNGVISNYEYLHYLNSMADRTFNDLTQYPVFPWVLSDHSSEFLDFDDPRCYRDLSKPVGALNPIRLKRLKERYEEMPEPKFLYGSHYSAPGFVLFYLVRKYPHYMLCLQNGRFDHPDRMFNSIPDVWKNVQNNMADFKELVPEFYDISCEGDFCNNFHGIDFGRRHDGSKVGDVELPGWAKDSSDFVKKMRNALESDLTSKNLHRWIDLIFGCKQAGEEAVRAHNVFYHLCYEGAVDLDSVKDPNQRHALEVQIMEFGQIPKQVFTLPHPCKLVNSPQHCLGSFSFKVEANKGNLMTCKETCISKGKCRWEWPKGLTKRLNLTLQSHREEVAGVALCSTWHGAGAHGKTPAGWHVFSVGHDSLLKIHDISTGQQVRSASLSSLPLSACVPLSVSHQSRIDSTLVVVASWDNTITVYDVEYGRVVEQATVHDDALSCLAWVEAEEEYDGILASGSWDCSVRLWRLLAPSAQPPSTVSPLGNSHRLLLGRPARSLLAQLEHEGRVTCLDYSRKAKILVSGTEDGDIYLWCMNTYSLKGKLKGHSSGSVSAVKVSPDGFRLVSCGSDSFIRVFDLKTSMEVYSKAMEEPLRSLAWNGSYLILGGSQGSLFVWDLVHVELIQRIEAHHGAVTSVAVSNDGSVIVTGGEDRKVNVWEPVS